jgi:hypothetical protein
LTKELTKALCSFYADVGVIKEDAKGAYGQFADLPTCLSTVVPALAKHGIIQSQTFEPTTEGGLPILVTTLMHESGESIQSRLPLIANQNKNAMFALGGSITYFRRYALLSILGLSADTEVDLEDYKEPEVAAPVSVKPDKPKPKKSNTPKDPPLSTSGNPSERDDVINSIKALKHEDAQQVINAFKKQFDIQSETIASHITSKSHAEFISKAIKHFT